MLPMQTIPLLETEPKERVGQLPLLATANDIRELVQFLKHRPQGVNVCDVVQPIKKRIFFPPKIDAYLMWGLVVKKGERLQLSTRGWDFALSLQPEAQCYRNLLSDTEYYEAALRWASAEGLDLITKDDLISFWLSSFASLAAANNEREMNQSVVTFFHLCQAAELGSQTIGKRGQPARLRIWQTALKHWLDTANSPRARDTNAVSIIVSANDGDQLVAKIRNVLKESGLDSHVTVLASDVQTSSGGAFI